MAVASYTKHFLVNYSKAKVVCRILILTYALRLLLYLRFIKFDNPSSKKELLGNIPAKTQEIYP